MNCEWCQAHVNDYVDHELNESDCAALENHLSDCAPCARLHADLTAILHCCLEVRQHPDAPPNAQALWLRISNLIEGEQKARELQPVSATGFVSRWFNQSWQLSFQQMASAVLATVVVTALATVIVLQRNSNPAPFPSAAVVTSQQNLSSQLLSGLGFTNVSEKRRDSGFENRLKDQQLAIEYWQRRVEQRKRQWNQNLRDAFDRNLRELDTVVVEYKQQLQTNPHDNVSEEMLDSALNDKMALLREFSEL